MRLSDLLGAVVVDAEGASIGRVRDARLVQDGPMQGTFGAGLRLAGLVVGPIAVGSRLGFVRSGVDAPALVARPVAWLDRGTRYVPWEAVVSIEHRRVVLDLPRSALERPAPASNPGADG